MSKKWYGNIWNFLIVIWSQIRTCKTQTYPFITHRNTYVHKNVNLNFKRLHGKSIMFVPEWNWKDPQNSMFRGKFIVTDFTACWSDVKCFFLYFRRFADVEVNGLLGLVERETVEPRWGHYAYKYLHNWSISKPIIGTGTAI